MKLLTLALSISGLLALTSGCAAGRNTTAGTAIGTGLGALTGAAIGNQTGHAGGGALIGAATGALAGGLIGNAEDARDERDAAIAQSRYERAVQQANAQAMNNSDLVLMTQSGVSDDVIITAVNTRGGHFDLSPGAIVQLKNSGVSDRVILAVQSARTAVPPLILPGSPTYLPAPEVIVVPARPTIGFGVMVGPRHYWGPHRHRHRW
jgi:outer membrane protein with glycine zipper